MKEQALAKQLEGMSAKDKAASEAMARRAGKITLQAVNEKFPHLADNSVSVGEKVGGGVLGWGVELGVRALVDKLGQPAADGTINTFGKHKDIWKGALSTAIGTVTLAANVAIPGKTEGSMGRRIASIAGVVTAAFGVDRLGKAQLGLPS